MLRPLHAVVVVDVPPPFSYFGVRLSPLAFTLALFKVTVGTKRLQVGFVVHAVRSNVQRYPVIHLDSSTFPAAGGRTLPPVPIEHLDANLAPPVSVWDCASPPAQPANPRLRTPELLGLRAIAPQARTKAALTSSREALLNPAFIRRTLPASSGFTIA